MYFKNNRYPVHGIMFHHFHDNKDYQVSPGSLDEYQLRKIIKFIGRENIINPEQFINRLHGKNFNKVCFTFDDALRCQYDIAQKVLDEFNIKAFYFIQTSIFDKKKDLTEIYRFFRNNFYKNVNNFYEEFELILKKKNKNFYKFLDKNRNLIKLKKKLYPFYTIQDIEFRLIRDNFLNKNEYKEIMLQIFKLKKFDYKSNIKKTFLNKSLIKKLFTKGNSIGLHSHSHTFNFDKLSFKDQNYEYRKNNRILKNIINSKIYSACYPGGKLNKYSLKVLKNLQIKCSFIDNIKKNKIFSAKYNNLLVPREDSTNIIKLI